MPTAAAGARGATARIVAASAALLAGLLTLVPAANAAPEPAASLRSAPAALATVRVRTTAQLLNALAAPAPRSIVIADGVYDHGRPFLNSSGHRVSAARPGRAVLRAGFVLGGNWGNGGGLLRGLRFDVASKERTLAGGVVTIWGTGRNSSVIDTTIDGNGVAATGVLVTQPEGIVIRRVRVRAVTDHGVALLPRDAPKSTSVRRPMVEDVRVESVARPVPRSSNGTAEACLWVATPTTVRRVQLRRCAWTGLWTGDVVRDSLFDRIRIDRTPVGVYAEHFTEGALFRRLHVGPAVSTGMICEWADPAWGGRAACHGVVVERSRIRTTKAGVYLDAGTSRTTVRHVTFLGQRWAGIGDHQGVGNAYSENVFRRLGPGARAVTPSHINSPP